MHIGNARADLWAEAVPFTTRGGSWIVRLRGR
jgi:hypothetical protein